MDDLKVLVVTDEIGDLSSLEAGRVIAAGWPRASVAVLPAGDAGAGFVRATADRLGLELISAATADGVVVSAAGGAGSAVVRVEGATTTAAIAYRASSYPLGEAMAQLLAEVRPRRLYVDLAGLSAHDGGAGLLAALGARADAPLDSGVAGLGDLTHLDLTRVHDRLGSTELIGVVTAAQVKQQLLGLRGITSLARTEESDPAQMLATDAALAGLAALAAPHHASTPGAGACGGLGFAVLALGGRLTTGPRSALAAVDLHGVDVMVTGCSVFDFHRRGGGVVSAVAEAAEVALSPCVVIAGEVVIGAREMRTMGIEAAYAVRESASDMPTGGVSAAELAETALRVGRSWSW
ncbi:MAG TPA: glycerate kinase [Propionibacteriaceae bacterium]